MTSEPTEPLFLPSGDSALVVEFGTAIAPQINARVLALDAALGRHRIPGLVETVPTYRSLMVQFDPLLFDISAFTALARELSAGLDAVAAAGRRWKVPVIYGGPFGIDLEATAERHKLTPAQLIERHSSAVYRVYMIGFMPGFVYLGGLDPALATPRRLDPRPTSPAGTISIGGIQALIAGAAMPSGWHLLGRTPVRTFMPGRDPAFLIAAGDEVVFAPTDAARWDALDRAAANGEPVAEVIAA